MSAAALKKALVETLPELGEEMAAYLVETLLDAAADSEDSAVGSAEVLEVIEPFVAGLDGLQDEASIEALSVGIATLMAVSDAGPVQTARAAQVQRHTKLIATPGPHHAAASSEVPVKPVEPEPEPESEPEPAAVAAPAPESSRSDDGSLLSTLLDALRDVDDDDTLEYLSGAIVGSVEGNSTEKLLVTDRDELIDLVAPLLVDLGTAKTRQAADSVAEALWRRLIAASGNRPAAAASKIMQLTWPTPAPLPLLSVQLAHRETETHAERRIRLALDPSASDSDCIAAERWRAVVGLPWDATSEQCARARERRDVLGLDTYATESVCSGAEAWRRTVGLPTHATTAQCLQARARREQLHLSPDATVEKCVAAEAKLAEASADAAARWRAEVGLSPDATTEECAAVLARDPHAVFEKMPGAARHVLEATLLKLPWVNTKGPGKGLRDEGRKGIAAIVNFSGGPIILVTTKDDQVNIRNRMSGGRGAYPLPPWLVHLTAGQASAIMQGVVRRYIPWVADGEGWVYKYPTMQFNGVDKPCFLFADSLERQGAGCIWASNKQGQVCEDSPEKLAEMLSQAWLGGLVCGVAAADVS